MHARATAQAAIEQRRRLHQHEDTLTAAFWVVEVLDKDALTAILREALGQPLCRDDADVVQFAAAKLGVTVGWKHVNLTTSEWGEGRGE